MKLKATKRYVDRYTRKIVEEGTVLDVSEQRAEELIHQKVVEKIKEPEKKSSKEEVAPEQPEKK